MTTKREALKLLGKINVHWSNKDDAEKLRAYIDSLPPDPFVLPEPGTEFVVRCRVAVGAKVTVEKFYHWKDGEVTRFRIGDTWNEGGLQNAGAEIVEEST